MMNSGWVQLEKKLKDVGYGEIRSLKVHDGAPVFDQDTRVFKQRLLNPPVPPCSHPDNHDGLKSEGFKELIRVCEEMGDGVVEKLVIQNGLPQRVKFEDGRNC